MKLGFLTACFPDVPLEEVAAWAGQNGFETLELAAWPKRARRDYMARHLDAANFTSDDAARMRDLLGGHGLTVSAMAYYDNNLHPDKKRREEHLAHLRRVIDAAALLGVDRVGTFVGARRVAVAKAMKEIGVIFRDIVRYAEDRGVRVMIENCPMDGWVTFGRPGNLAYSPELWDALFDEVPSPNFGLNFDPSHLHWLGIDPIRAVRDYGPRIFHAHAKDTEMLPEGRYRFGVQGEQLKGDPWHSGWWRYRMPGRGDLDWKAFVDALRAVGYDDVLSIEHEDPEFEGSRERVQEGLRLGREHLAACL